MKAAIIGATLAAVVVCPASSQDAGNADKVEFADRVAEENSCVVLLPIQTQAINTSNRLGAVLSLKQLYEGKAAPAQPLLPQIFTRDTQKYWCTPEDDYKLPDITTYQDGTSIAPRQVVVDKGAGINIQYGSYLKLLNISYTNIKAVSVELADAKAYELSPGNQKRVVKALLGREDCNDTLKQKSARLIMRVCTGQVTFGIYLKEAITGQILNLAIGQLSAGADFHYVYEADSVAPCSSTSSKADPKASPTSDSKPTETKAGGKSAESPATKPKVDAAKKPAKEAGKPNAADTGGLKSSVAVTSGPITLSISAGSTNTTASSTQTTAADDPAKPAAPGDQAKIDPNKCYNYALVKTKPNSVYGVNLTDRSGPLSLQELIKAVNKK